MTGNVLALDTNIAIALLTGDPAVAARVRQAGVLVLPVIVLGELRFGALNSTKPAENLAPVDRLAAECQVLPIDARTAAFYADVRAALKKRGRPIPENDVWIAALCVQHTIPLATRDAHFGEVAALTTHAM